MWRDSRNKRDDFSRIYCPKCNEICESLHFQMSSTRKCVNCKNVERLFRCKQTTCGFFECVCPNCYGESLKGKKSKKKNKELYGYIKKSMSDLHRKSIFLVGTLLIIGIISIILRIIYFHKSTGSFENENVVVIENLKKDYPSQKNETWYHFLGVLEKGIPSVKSITFLHGKDKGTSNCLANELVLLYTKNKNVKSEDITFSNFEADDYGFVLKHYHTIVQKFGVFMTDLNKVSGNVARIFHSLCDEVSSDIKPSLFIFTLKYDERTVTWKPIERATYVLRKTWNDLPENELFPLLSRIIKNVVDIVPEHQIHC